MKKQGMKEKKERNWSMDVGIIFLDRYGQKKVKTTEFCRFQTTRCLKYAGGLVGPKLDGVENLAGDSAKVGSVEADMKEYFSLFEPIEERFL